MKLLDCFQLSVTFFFFFLESKPPMTEASSGIHDHEDDQPTRELPQNEEVFYSDLERVRGALGFASSHELRARAATVFTSGRYARPNWLARRRVLVDTAAQTATEGLRRDIGVMNGNAMADVDQARTIELDNVMSIPRPADFPVLTAAQLTEAEQRVSTILRRIEQELDNVEQEEAAALRRLQGYDPYGATEHISSQDWNERMERLVSTRLELKYQHAKDPVILDWHRKGLHEASSPLRQARGGVTGVQRGLVGARTDNAPPQGGVGGGGPALVGGNVGLRARNASATKSLALAKSGPLFPDMLNFMNDVQRQIKSKRSELDVEFTNELHELQRNQRRGGAGVSGSNLSPLPMGASASSLPIYGANNSAATLPGNHSFAPPPALSSFAGNGSFRR